MFRWAIGYNTFPSPLLASAAASVYRGPGSKWLNTLHTMLPHLVVVGVVVEARPLHQGEGAAVRREGEAPSRGAWHL